MTGKLEKSMTSNDEESAIHSFDFYCQDIGEFVIDEPVEECRRAISSTHVVELRTTHNV